MYIPQYSDKTASLNVAIAGSIIFHHFALWAQYEEAGRTEQKFDVGQYQPGAQTKIIIHDRKENQIQEPDDVPLDIFDN